MFEVLPILLAGLLGQVDACSEGAFVERILLPMNESQKGHAGFTMNREGGILAITSRSCGDRDPCEDNYQGRLLNCQNEAVSDVFPMVDRFTSQGGTGAKEVATSPGGDLFVVWAPFSCVRGRAFDREGLPLADQVVLAPGKCFDQANSAYYSFPVVTSAGSSEDHVVAWAEYNTRGDRLLGSWIPKRSPCWSWSCSETPVHAFSAVVLPSRRGRDEGRRLGGLLRRCDRRRG